MMSLKKGYLMRRSLFYFSSVSILIFCSIFIVFFQAARSRSVFCHDDYKNVEKFQRLALANHVDFDISMKSDLPHRFDGKVGPMRLIKVLNHLYKENSLGVVKPGLVCKIPKIFHYIWFGIKLPDKYRPLLQTWINKHPDWTFIFWVDNPENYDLGDVVQHENFDSVEDLLDSSEAKGGRFVVDVKSMKFANRDFFDGTRNYGERSDIFRWSAVYRLGGVYIDVDCECFKPLDILHYTYDFYTGIQPLDTTAVQLGAALFGAIPGHPILEQCVKTIKNDSKYEKIVVRTGPIHFSFCFLSAAGTTGLRDVAFPASYFYPCSFDQAGLPCQNWIQPESFATHHWAGSWLKKEAWDRS